MFLGAEQNPVDVEGQRKHRDDLRALALPRSDRATHGAARPERSRNNSPGTKARRSGTNNLHFFVVERTTGTRTTHLRSFQKTTLSSSGP